MGFDEPLKKGFGALVVKHSYLLREYTVFEPEDLLRSIRLLCNTVHGLTFAAFSNSPALPSCQAQRPLKIASMR